MQKEAEDQGLLFMRILLLNIILMHENGSFQMEVRVVHLRNSQLDSTVVYTEEGDGGRRRVKSGTLVE